MKDVKLENRYTGEIVYCRNLDKITTSGDMVFIRVYKQENPEREYLVNRAAFEVVE